MNCPNCNQGIYNGEKFCPNCGAAIQANNNENSFTPVSAVNPYNIPQQRKNSKGLMITAYVFFGIAFICFAFYLIILLNSSSNSVTYSGNDAIEGVEEYIDDYADAVDDVVNDYIQ